MKTYPENVTLDPLDWNLCSISCKKHKKSKLETPNIKLNYDTIFFYTMYNIKMILTQVEFLSLLTFSYV